MLYTIMFSPTGGTSKAARRLAEGFSMPQKEVDLFHKGYERRIPELSPEDICIVAAPVYSGRIPAIEAERIRLIQGNGAKAVALAVYGNCKPGDAILELGDLLKDCGFKLIAGIEAIAEHSLIRKFAAGRPDAEDVKLLKNFAAEIENKIIVGDMSEPVLPGNRPYKIPNKSTLHPFVLNGCINCGICARECPAAAISFSGNWVADTDKCISCMHCIRFCPKSYRILDETALKALEERLAPIAAVRKENKLYI